MDAGQYIIEIMIRELDERHEEIIFGGELARQLIDRERGFTTQDVERILSVYRQSAEAYGIVNFLHGCELKFDVPDESGVDVDEFIEKYREDYKKSLEIMSKFIEKGMRIAYKIEEDGEWHNSVG